MKKTVAAITSLLLSCGGSDTLTQAPEPPLECFDGNPCTTDEIVDEACVYTPRPDEVLGCDGKETRLECSGGELLRRNTVDLLVEGRETTKTIWGYIGCREVNGQFLVAVGDPNTTYPFPVCFPGEVECIETDILNEFYYRECRSLTTSDGQSTEPIWDAVLCEEYCAERGFSGSNGCNGNESDCECI